MAKIFRNADEVYKEAIKFIKAIVENGIHATV
jgi:hypothetical protein